MTAPIRSPLSAEARRRLTLGRVVWESLMSIATFISVSAAEDCTTTDNTISLSLGAVSQVSKDRELDTSCHSGPILTRSVVTDKAHISSGIAKPSAVRHPFYRSPTQELNDIRRSILGEAETDDAFGIVEIREQTSRWQPPVESYAVDPR